MSTESNEQDLKNTQELFDVLQGTFPEGYDVSRDRIPKLTPDQAWTVIWYLGNKDWQVTDRVERCCVCGDLYHTWNSGACLDYGRAPYCFCDNCITSPAFVNKMRRNPDKAEREAFFAK
jgi:hypothetical protein